MEFDSHVGDMRVHSDRHGNVIALLDWNGFGVEKYTYDAFGRPTILSANNTQLSTSAVGNRFMFTGREWLAAINAYDYRHRLYDPDLGRFLQTDPLGFKAGDMNLFRYCGDDPIDRTDPDGLYGRPKGEWTDKDWEKYRANQEKAIDRNQRAKNAIDHAREHPEDKSSKATIRAFQKKFGPATAERMAKVSNDLGKKLAALRDDGTNGYWAHSATDKDIAAKGKDPNTVPAYTYLLDKNVWVNIGSGRWSNYVLQWAIDHEAGHSAADLRDLGYTADWRYNAISNPTRLRNADSSTAFVHEVTGR